MAVQVEDVLAPLSLAEVYLCTAGVPVEIVSAEFEERRGLSVVRFGTRTRSQIAAQHRTGDAELAFSPLSLDAYGFPPSEHMVESKCDPELVDYVLLGMEVHNEGVGRHFGDTLGIEYLAGNRRGYLRVPMVLELCVGPAEQFDDCYPTRQD